MTDKEFELYLDEFISRSDGNSDDKENNVDFQINKIKVIFHVHLPENIEKYGYPVVLGNAKELGLWENFIVKLHQPYPQNPTYWKSDPVTISLSNSSDILYKYAIHVSNSLLQDEKIVFEGNSEHVNRILNIFRTDQFDIWKNNNLSERYCIHHNDIDDFAFVEYIYNTIKEDNLKDKVKEYQYLLTQYTELTVWTLSRKFIIDHLKEKLKEKRLFMSSLGILYEDLLAKFIKEAKIIIPYNIKDIEFGTYVKLDKWLIQLCHNMDSLFRLWNDILLHNNAFDKSVSKCFVDQSYTLELLNIFPEILDNCFRNDFSDTEGRIPKALRVKEFSDTQIFATTNLIVQIKDNNIKKIFLEMVKEILDKTVRQINDWLLNKIFIICDCKRKTLVVPHSISEDILSYIMTKLQKKSEILGHYDILKDDKFWNIILHATGSVKKLNSNPFIKHAKTSIEKLGGLFLEKTVDLYSLQQTLEYSDEKLFQQLSMMIYGDNHLRILDFKNNLISINQNFENLQNYSELYYNDFIKITISTYMNYKSINKEQLDFVLKHLIGDKITNNPFVLHIYWWKYINNILVQLKLIEKYPDIITKAHNDFIVYGKLDYYLFRKVINSILQNIYEDKPRKQDTDDILSLINDSKKSLNFFDLDLLLICYDLSKINLIPLDKNDDDIVPIRSFITRILEFIPLDSEVRLILYKNLFSRDPFELVNIIIKKVFITEYQQNKRIFLKLIKNSKKILELSKRLSIINDNIKKLDSDMAVICCEIIQPILNEFKLIELSTYFKYSIRLFTDQGLSSQRTSILQQLTSIAFLKEFISKYWKNYIQKDNFFSKSLIEEINNGMKINHSFIQYLQSYFISNLYCCGNISRD
ncbi:hypothetical protein GLOIN_2v432849 [Rhizophagus clarus]|uniref:CBM20 domain-containing protein n=1 Tax=Rhizophagus clarus TaxID=94130 RepID=A0A8H3KT09_9GLOM|nr:hypothetical protein GLOIN_2v432849 [Rhizophagus clarus]